MKTKPKNTVGNKILWTDHGQTELRNILVKNVFCEINKGTFTKGFKDCRKIKRKVILDLDDLKNSPIKLTVKASSEKAWLLLSFHLL